MCHAGRICVGCRACVRGNIKKKLVCVCMNTSAAGENNLSGIIRSVGRNGRYARRPTVLAARIMARSPLTVTHINLEQVMALANHFSDRVLLAVQGEADDKVWDDRGG